MGITRLYTFNPNTVISSTQVNAEFNQLVNILNGVDSTNNVSIGGTQAVVNNFTQGKVLVVGRVDIVLPSSGTSLAIWRSGDDALATNPRVSISNLGAVRVLASQSEVVAATAQMTLDGVLYSLNDVSTTGIAGNVGAGEDDLTNFTIYGRTFGASAGTHHIEVWAYGLTAANGNNKRVKFYVKTTPVLDTGSVAFNNKPWAMHVHIFGEPGVSKVRVCGYIQCDTTLVYCNTEVASYDCTVDADCKWTGTATADNDVVITSFVVRKGALA